MKKTIITLSLAAAIATVGFADAQTDALEAKINKLEKKLNKLSKKTNKIKAATAKDNIKWSVDLRTSYDAISYKTYSGKTPSNNLLSNRLILGMAQKPTDDLIFKGKVVVNKVFGHSNTLASNGFNNYDWFGSESPDDSVLRLREAYFVKFGNIGDVRYTASVGRRPSINGTAGNFRDDDNEASPLAHNINMEFDGASFNFILEDAIGVQGSAFKICLGRGYSDTVGKYDTTGQASYVKATTTKTDSPDMDMIGFIAKLYDDGQYKSVLNVFQAQNLLGLRGAAMTSGFEDKGDMTGGAFTLITDGIGDGISDFLDDSKFFASYAWSKTDPKSGKAMLGSTEVQEGNSTYVGLQVPAMITNEGKFGLEWNKGSKYWRSFTYGEDTLIGSKLAARGTAIEAYYTQPMSKNLSFQIRHTQIKYDYAGSDMFFGNSGMPSFAMQSAGGADPVKEATNTRAYIRYQY